MLGPEDRILDDEQYKQADVTVMGA